MLPNRLRILRKKNGLTMKELAENMGTSQQQIDRLEKGQRKLTVEWLERFTEEFNCDVYEILPDNFEQRNILLTIKSKVIGKIEKNKDITWFSKEDYYPIIFSRPTAIENSNNTKLFSLVNYCNDGSIDFPEKSELIFSEIDSKIKENTIRKNRICVYYSRANDKHFISKNIDNNNDNDKQIKAVLVKSIRDEL